MRKANIRDIVNYIIVGGTTNTQSGSWCVYFDEIEEEFEVELTQEMKEEIERKLSGYPHVAEIEVDNYCFDIIFWLGFCGVED